jgi:putative N6-adenine-specific DNA methylase
LKRSSEYEAFAVVAPGLETLAAAELRELGLAVTDTETGGVSFRTAAAGLYGANLRLRTVSRIIVRVAAFRATAFWELEKQAKKIPWEGFVAPGGRVTFGVTARKSRLYHQRAIAQRLADAVAQRVSGATESDDPSAQLFVVRASHDEFTISADSSGALLHQRGYRQATAKAPLRETLAAAMLLGAGWNGTVALLDPFCGSGTIVIEAALLARRIPPGWNRSFGFEGWPSFDAALWRKIRTEAEVGVLARAPGRIVGSDRDAGAIDAARANAARAGVDGDVELQQLALSGVIPPAERGWIITNPPYGVRVGEAARLRDLYARFGQLATTRFSDWSIGMLSADQRLTGHTRLPLEETWRSRTGGIPVRFLIRQSEVTL